MIDNQVGPKIRELRKNAGFSQAEFATRLAVDQSYISKIERGITSPSVTLLQKIGKLFDTTHAYITVGWIPSDRLHKFGADPEAELISKASEEALLLEENTTIDSALVKTWFAVVEARDRVHLANQTKGQLNYSDISLQAIDQLKKSAIPGLQVELKIIEQSIKQNEEKKRRKDVRVPAERKR